MGKLLAVLALILFLLPAVPLGETPKVPQSHFSAPPGGTNYPWAMFRHDSLRSGATLASAPSSGSLMWTLNIGATIYSSPAVVNGAVYIATYDATGGPGRLYAIDEYSGSQKWVFATGAPIYASPAVANGIVYITSRDSFLYAINAQTGLQAWPKVSSISPITSSPVVVGGYVYYGTWFNRFWAEIVKVDASTGAVVWRYQNADDNIVSSPSIHNGRVFFGQNNGYVVAINETDRAELWKTRVPNPGQNTVIGGAPAVVNGRVFVGTDNRFAAFDEITGAHLWDFNTGGSNATSGAVNNDIVYFGTGAGWVYAVNATNGQQIWARNMGAVVSSAPSLALGSNSLLVGAHDRYVYALDMATGNQQWRYRTGGAVSSSPAIADGRVFLGSQDHNVYGLGPIAPALQVSITVSQTVLKPGEISTLTMTVTNGTSPETGVTMTLSSTSGGGFTAPTESSPGIYQSNYTSPLVTQQTTAVITVLASKSGFLDDSASTSLTLTPFPPLSVVVTPRPSSVTPGGEVVLLILVSNGTQPMPGASIFPSSTEGSFSGVTDAGDGNYTVVYSAGLQNSNPTVTVQASKPGFSTGQAQVTITVSGVLDLTTVKFYGLPLFAILAGAFLFFFAVFVLMLTRRKAPPDHTVPYVPNYSWDGRVVGEGLSGRFRGWLVMGLAAIAGS